MNKRLSIKNPAIFAIISFVAILGVSFMLVFSAVASSNSAAAPENTEVAEETAAAVEVVAQTQAEPETQKSVTPSVTKEAPAPATVKEAAEEAEPVAEEKEAVEAEDAEAEASELVAFITEDQVNFRSAPDASDDSNVIYILYYGSTHNVVGNEGAWTIIDVDGFGEGYVYSDYVSVQEGGEISSYASVVAAAMGAAAAGNDEMGLMEYEQDEDDADVEEAYDNNDDDVFGSLAFVNEDHVNFRSAPGTDSNVICSLFYGSTHEVLGTEGNWTLVYVDGFGEGYVSSDFITFTDGGEISSYSEIISAMGSDDDDEDYDDADYDDDDSESYNTTYSDPEDPYASLRQEIANYACSFAGWLPYVWGSHSLEYGADCSGFTAAVYAQFGYSLSYSSDVQSCQGYSVPVSEILPGDIIVYSGHVAMYVGDGLKVHAPYPGTTVTIDSMYYSTILDVRRIIG